jgi:hypothetical protein
MAEIVIVPRSRREHCDQRIVPLDALQKLGLHLLEVGGKPHGMAGVEDIAHELAVQKPVRQGEAGAGGRFGVNVDDAPRPV